MIAQGAMYIVLLYNFAGILRQSQPTPMQLTVNWAGANKITFVGRDFFPSSSLLIRARLLAGGLLATAGVLPNKDNKRRDALY